MIEFQYHDSVNVLRDLCHHGQRSRAQSPFAKSPFDRAEWYELLAATGLTPLIAIAGDTDDAAALALTERNGHITPLRNWYSFSWRQLAPEGEHGDRLIVEIARQLKARGFRVTLEPVPDEDGSAARLARAFQEAGWKVTVEPCDINHVLHVDGRDFAEYCASRPGRMRTTLKRKAKRVRVEVLDHFDLVAWEAYERIYAESWKPAEDQPAMLRDFARAEGEAGRLRLGLAFEGDLAVAAKCWTVENGCAYIHKLAHLESHKQLSAGTTLSAALFEHVIDRDKVSLIDFGTGDQPYKADWMEETRLRYRIDCLDPGQPRAWPAIAKRTIRHVRQKLAPRPAQS